MSRVLYPLRTTREGRQVGEFPVGTVAWSLEEGVVLDCPDRDLFRRLHRHFSGPLLARRGRGSAATVLTHEWQELAPGTEEHFHEALARLHRLGVVAREA